MAITEFFHLIHIVDNEDDVDQWYDAVFSPNRFSDKHWFDLEKRWASLSLIGDFMIEVIEPSDDPDHQGAPLGRFRNRFGQHFHSLSWYTDAGGIKPLFDRIRALGVRVAQPGGGMFPDGDIDPGPTIFTHPKDTFGQLEFVDVSEHWSDTDPRFQPGWSSAWWAESHPLGIRRVSHFTTIVTDLDRAQALYEHGLGARRLSNSTNSTQESVFMFVGNETVVELARPIGTGTPIAHDLDANGELPHACTFLVGDLEAAERHVDKVGVRVAGRSEETLTLNPDDCFGARYAFTTMALDGDPRL
jgi:catechol 2,3-dioxygenase-like lactoylglutathione lyase family enzyme